MIVRPPGKQHPTVTEPTQRQIILRSTIHRTRGAILEVPSVYLYVRPIKIAVPAQVGVVLSWMTQTMLVHAGSDAKRAQGQARTLIPLAHLREQ